MITARMRRFAPLLSLAVCLWGTPPLAAQEPVIEEQVALDEGGRLLRVDAELARTLGVFGDLSDVREILLFRSADGYVLEVTRRRGGVLIRERRRLSEAEVARLRADVSGALALRAPSALVDRSGRYVLLATSTAAGLGFYGWAVPYALDIEDTKGQVGLYMLVSAASFFGPWLWSADRPVTLGMANGAFWGASRGIVHGIGLHRIVAGEVQCLPGDFGCSERESWERGRVATALVASLSEGIGALAWAKAAQATAGDAHLVGVASDFGAVGAVALGVLAGSDDLGASAYWGFSLAGAAAGVGGGVALRARRDYSWGDVEVFRAAGLLGAYTGIAAADIVGSDEARLFAGLGLAGGTAGLILGDRLVRDRDIGAGQGLLVDLGTVAGGLLGLGVAVLVSDESSSSETIFLSLSTLGAWSGFAATYGSLEERPRPDRREGSSERPRDESALRLDLVPFPDATRGGSLSLPPLALRLRYRF
ncbi:MAG: hypothetical protein KY466_00600 [Gemmatimonadetes bacterium]|nr:hypothetical protein [Gemmatimonadota bacterium]